MERLVRNALGFYEMIDDSPKKEPVVVAESKPVVPTPSLAPKPVVKQGVPTPSLAPKPVVKAAKK